eukprot:341964-Pelagomonas_calceolata.AAC.1
MPQARPCHRQRHSVDANGKKGHAHDWYLITLASQLHHTGTPATIRLQASVITLASQPHYTRKPVSLHARAGNNTLTSQRHYTQEQATIHSQAS